LETFTRDPTRSSEGPLGPGGALRFPGAGAALLGLVTQQPKNSLSGGGCPNAHPWGRDRMQDLHYSCRLLGWPRSSGRRAGLSHTRRTPSLTRAERPTETARCALLQHLAHRRNRGLELFIRRVLKNLRMLNLISFGINIAQTFKYAAGDLAPNPLEHLSPTAANPPPDRAESAY